MLARLRAAVPTHRINYFVHAGNSLAVVASMSEDMVQLRSFMIGATACSMCFNALQRPALWTPVYWGSFFVSMHAYQIAKILRERQSISLSEREARVYESAFLPYGFTPRQFVSLMATGSFVTLTPGATCASQGEPVRALHLVTACGPEATIVVEQETDDAGQPVRGARLSSRPWQCATAAQVARGLDHRSNRALGSAPPLLLLRSRC